MESLGGNAQWQDRFVASHASLAYYWLVVILFVTDPKLAYNFSLLVEDHAHVTYTQFVEENAEILKQVPPPPLAVHYYGGCDLYQFERFQTCSANSIGCEIRQPPCANMLDVFRNIRDDENEHRITMKACEEWWGGGDEVPYGDDLRASLGDRKEWKRWANELDELDITRSHC